MTAVLPFPSTKPDATGPGPGPASGAGSNPEVASLPTSVVLQLVVRDPEIVAELVAAGNDEQREEYAVKALRIGVLALRQARGQLDVEQIRREGDRLLSTLQMRLEEHSKTVHERTTLTLREYFDPQSGRFQERVERLIRRDGELEQLLRRQLGGEDSELTKTLSNHFGQESELLQWLNPDQSRGLLAALRGTLGEQLQAQRDQVLQQFSLDNKEGALTRFIDELSNRQEVLSGQLEQQIDAVVKQFSLDQDDSALSRLVANVERAQRTITREFSLDEETSALSRLKRLLDQTNSTIDSQLSLDEETSPLARLKRELLGILDTHRDQNQKFQEEVKVSLQGMLARKEEAARSTRHGLEFEAAVVDLVQRESQKTGDIAEATGNRTGRVKNCKKGDLVIEMGPDSVAPGARIVVEAKEVAGFQLPEARQEIEEARKNRDATVGLFVFSRRTAPVALEPLARWGQDVVVVWDPEEAQSDLYLKAGISVARALAVRQQLKNESQTADFQAVEQALVQMEKTLTGFDELQMSAEQVGKHSEKMLKRVDLMRKELVKQLETVQTKTQALRQTSV
jgi:hypothetical protein